jgi:uncharacterized protein (TIGR00255 family)
MTGFGKGSAVSSTVQIDVELRSVNSRFLDFNFKIPREYAEFEPVIRESLQDGLTRGRVDVFIQRTATSVSEGSVFFNRPMFDAFRAVYDEAATRAVCQSPSFQSEAILHILARREVLEVSTAVSDASSEKEQVLAALTDAKAALLTMREREGATLAADLSSRITHIRELAKSIQSASSTSVVDYKRRLEERMKVLEVDGVVDAARIAAEAALLADRTDITEELVRIFSHCEQWESAAQEYPQGRKFDFILQEFGREFNTISSKTQRGDVQTFVVDAKSTLEKMREQAANIE